MSLRRILAASVSLGAACLASCLLALLACGSSKSTGEPRADAGPFADAQADAPDKSTGVGVITFSEAPDGAGTFFAGFTERAPAAPAGCEIVDAGGCTTTTCPPLPTSDSGTGTDGAAQADAQPAVAPNPGRLKITGGVFGSGFYIDPDKDGTYLYASPGILFSPGDSLGVAALGGVLPAFPDQTIEAPPVLALTAPGGDGGKVTVSTSQPLAFSWTGGRAGDEAVVTATSYFTSGGLSSMTCSWDASTGAATAPSDSLRPLASQNAVSSNIVWYQLAQKKFSTGPVAVTVSAYAPQGMLVAFQ